MKKLTILIAAIALVCFAAPAMAVEWNFYGNARMATYWVSNDQGGAKDQDLQWDLQSNSRFGANVKAENITARVEMGISESNVSARRAYGVWNFGSGTMKVGKDYTPTSQFISGQVFDGDLGLLGIGTNYGSRHGQIAFGFGGFNIALINPNSGFLAGMTTSVTGSITVATGGGSITIPGAVTTSANGDIDEIIPKIEASWGTSYDAWNFNLMGGVNYYSISDVVSSVDGSTDDLDVTSYIIGGDVGFNFGPGYVKAALSYGSNIGNANWSIPSLAGGTSGQGGLAMWDGDDDTNDVDTFQGALVGGMKVSDMLSFEGGFGYRNDNTDGGAERNTSPWAVYLQSVIALAPGVYIIPEVGYYDYDNDAAGDDQGSLFYLGGKWQINF
jgi:maltoporin